VVLVLFAQLPEAVIDPLDLSMIIAVGHPVVETLGIGVDLGAEQTARPEAKGVTAFLVRYTTPIEDSGRATRPGPFNLLP
jgi:hypothetical protein